MKTVFQSFELNQDAFKAIVKGFKAEFVRGLNTSSASGLATMIPSFVTQLPTGQETGTFLSLDLGGSTLRVCAVNLLGQSEVKVTQLRRSITQNDPIRSSTRIKFFDWIADAVHELVQQIGAIQSSLSLGVCWSFPIDQTSISKGKILRMGKGYTIKGVEGHYLVDLLHEAFKRKNLNVKVTALVNDTVGTLVAHAYTNPETRIGFVYGTGVNAAYAEKTSRMTKLPQHCQSNEKMLVNTEIDIFGSEGYLPLNKYDLQLNANHTQPNFQLYEKMMSGAYLGELVRLAALDLIDQGLLFQRHRPKEFNTPFGFDTAVPSKIESHIQDPPHKRWKQFETLFSFHDPYTVEEQDLDILTRLCQSVSDRGAKLAGAALVSLIEQQEDLLRAPIVIGINGTTFEKYPRISERIHQALVLWFGPDIGQRIRLEVATDGGSIGGALIAMLAEKEKQKKVSWHSCFSAWTSLFTLKGSYVDKEK